MANRIDNGGPAFPAELRLCEQGLDGISVRDYFAAKALQGFVSILKSPQKGDDTDAVFEDIIATNCYRFADAMISARNGFP